MWAISFSFLLLITSLAAVASGVDEERANMQAFIVRAFGQQPPAPQRLWLDESQQSAVAAILGHDYHRTRVRYWRHEDTLVWFLEEIGKEEFITAGFIVKHHRINTAEVITYREHRGGEIQYPTFLKQFSGLALTADHTLNGAVDGITGATLSVRAMKKMAAMALYLTGLL